MLPIYPVLLNLVTCHIYTSTSVLPSEENVFLGHTATVYRTFQAGVEVCVCVGRGGGGGLTPFIFAKIKFKKKDVTLGAGHLHSSCVLDVSGISPPQTMVQDEEPTSGIKLGLYCLV